MNLKGWRRIFLDDRWLLKYNRHILVEKGQVPVTVCVAAMFGGSSIIGASDRMLTAGDVEFEPQQTKIIGLTTSIALMVAGDSSMQAEVLQNLWAATKMKIDSAPDVWLDVRYVVEKYSDFYNEARFRRAERSILAPLGLNNESFISKQREMDPGLVRQISTELLNFESPTIQVIFTGLDNSGPHIYVAHNGDISCRDNVGFAAIGAGYWHANSQMMFAGHTRFKLFPETLLLVFSAKKRAEVAPGVGKATDMFMISGLGSYVQVDDHHLMELEKIYKAEQARERRAAIKARESANRYVEEITRASTAKEQATIPQDSRGDASANKKELRDITEGNRSEN